MGQRIKITSGLNGAVEESLYGGAQYASWEWGQKNEEAECFRTG